MSHRSRARQFVVSRRRFASAALLAATAAAAALAAPGLLGAGGSALGSDYIPNNSNWSDPSNWNPFGVPTGSSATANVNLAPGGPFGISMNFNYSAASALGTVALNSSNANALTLNINANLFADGQFLGMTSGGNATIVHSGFTNSASGGLLVGYVSGSTGSYNLSATGNLYVNVYETLGYQGTAHFTQTGGTNTVGTAGSGQFRLGEQGGSIGNYALSGSGNFTVNGTALIGDGGTGNFTQTGGSSTVNGTEFLGYNGTGNYTHSAGSHSVTGELRLGNLAGSSGNYTLSGSGNLAVNTNEYVGNSGTGTFTQSGGTHTVGNPSITTNQLILAGASGSVANYNLSGGNLVVNGFVNLGPAGAGTFTQTGGSHSISRNLQIGFFSGSTGTYNQSGGSLTTDGLRVGNEAGSNGSFILSNTASLMVTGDEFVGFFGTGSFTHSGGTHTIGTPANARSFILGQFSGSNGNYTLSGTGSLTANGNEYIGAAGTGILTQTGGTHTVGSTSATASLHLGYNPGSSGSYALSGTGSLSVTDLEFVGYSGAGTFTHTGGTHTIGNPAFLGSGLTLGQDSGSSGSYALSGSGVLTVNGYEMIGANGAGAFTQSSGAHTVGNPAFSSQISLFIGAFATGSYSLSGTGSLRVKGFAEYIGYSGTGIGGFTQSGGTHTVDGGLRLGVLANSSGSYDLSGTGSLTVNGTEYVGQDGIGSFTQSGGTHTVGTPSINASLILGSTGTAEGIYDLSGNGSLTVNGIEYIGYSGGQGTFTQSGGAHDVTSGLYVADSSGSNGSYALSGGSLTVDSIESLGRGGVGSFTQTGGGHSIDGSLLMGAGGSGSYALSGTGTLAVAINEVLGHSGAGTFIQTGGTHTVGTDTSSTRFFILGSIANSSGSYDLSGSGNLTVNGVETIGSFGTGSFIQSGGTHSISANLQIGFGGPGSFSLSGGSLSVGEDEYIGILGAGSLTQSGGTHAVGRYQFIGDSAGSSGGFTHSGGSNTIGSPLSPTGLAIGGWHGSATGSYSLSGSGNLRVNGTTYVGGVPSTGGLGTPGGIGTLNISGGTASTDWLTVFDTGPASPAGTRVNLSGGTLSVGGLDLSGNLSRFNWTGGELNFYAPFLVDATGPLGASLSLNTGMTLTTNQSLTNNGTIALAGGTIGGSGQINNTSAITGYGTIAGNGGFINNGTVRQGAGNLVFSNFGTPNTNFGNIHLAADRQFQPSGAGAILVNRGAINLNGAIITGTGTLNNAAGATLFGHGTISSVFTNSAGAVVVDGGALNVTGNFSNGGLISLNGGAASLTGGDIANTGRIAGAGSVGSAIVNASGGRVDAGAGGTLTLGGVVTNNAGGTLASGVAGSTLLLATGLAAHTNSGTIALDGGTFDYSPTSALTNNGTISGRGTLLAGAGLVNNGQVQLSAGFSDVRAAVAGNNGSRIIVTGGSTSTFYHAITLNSGSEFRVSTGSTAVFLGAVTGFGPGSFTGSGTKIFEAGSSNVSSVATLSGATVVEAPATLTTGHVREASLTVNGRVNVSADGGAAGLSRVGALQINSGGRLDLNDNDLLVDYTGSSLEGAIRQLVRDGRATGSGITTTTTAANDTVLAIADTAEFNRTVWLGQTLDASTIIGKYTYFGDSNLDGMVTGDDYLAVDSTLGIGDDWIEGDFNLDNAVTGDDYLAIDTNLGKGTPNPLAFAELKAEMIAKHAAMFGEEYLVKLAEVGANGFTTVPEPAAVALAALIPFIPGRRRRRRPHKWA